MDIIPSQWDITPSQPLKMGNDPLPTPGQTQSSVLPDQCGSCRSMLPTTVTSQVPFVVANFTFLEACWMLCKPGVRGARPD